MRTTNECRRACATQVVQRRVGQPEFGKEGAVVGEDSTRFTAEDLGCVEVKSRKTGPASQGQLIDRFGRVRAVRSSSQTQSNGHGVCERESPLYREFRDLVAGQEERMSRFDLSRFRGNANKYIIMHMNVHNCDSTHPSNAGTCHGSHAYSPHHIAHHLLTVTV